MGERGLGYRLGGACSQWPHALHQSSGLPGGGGKLPLAPVHVPALMWEQRSVLDQCGLFFRAPLSQWIGTARQHASRAREEPLLPCLVLGSWDTFSHENQQMRGAPGWLRR